MSARPRRRSRSRHDLIATAAAWSLAAATLLAACAGEPRATPPPPEPVRSIVEDDGLRIVATRDELVLTSRDTVPLYYRVMAEELAARIEWAPCADPECPAVPPGGETRIGFANVAGSPESGASVVVFWWRLELAKSRGRVPGRVRSATVRRPS